MLQRAMQHRQASLPPVSEKGSRAQFGCDGVLVEEEKAREPKKAQETKVSENAHEYRNGKLFGHKLLNLISQYACDGNEMTSH